MTRVNYQKDADGNWILVAAFCIGLMPERPSDWPTEIEDWLEEEGCDVKVVDVEIENLKPAYLS